MTYILTIHDADVLAEAIRSHHLPEWQSWANGTPFCTKSLLNLEFCHDRQKSLAVDGKTAKLIFKRKRDALHTLQRVHWFMGLAFAQGITTKAPQARIDAN